MSIALLALAFLAVIALLALSLGILGGLSRIGDLLAVMAAGLPESQMEMGQEVWIESMGQQRACHVVAIGPDGVILLRPIEEIEPTD